MEDEWIRTRCSLKATFSRMMLSREYLLALVMAVILSLVSVPLLWRLIDIGNAVSMDLFEVFRNGGNYNLFILTLPTLELKGLAYYDVVAEGVLSGSMMQYMVIVLVGVNVVSEFKYGYAKISVIKGMTRYALVAQYMVVSMVSVIPVLMIYEVGVMVSMHIQGIYAIENMGSLIIHILLRMLMLCTIAGCMAACSIIIRGYPAVVIGILGAMSLPSLPYYLQALTGRGLWLESLNVTSLLTKGGDYLDMNIGGVFFAVVLNLTVAAVLSVICLVNTEV